MSVSARAPIALLLLACALVLTLFWGGVDRQVTSPGEARVAQIAYEMQQRGDYLLPSLRGEVSEESLTKPPLFHWLVIASSSPFHWQDFSLRIVPILAGIGSIWLVFLLGRRMFDAETGVWSAWVLASCFVYMHYALGARIDIFFAFLILAAISAFYFATTAPDKTKHLAVFFLVTGLAVMAKGPAGFIIPIGVALLYLWSERNTLKAGEHLPLWGWGLCLVLGGAWYLLVLVKAPPELVHNMFLGEPANWLEGKPEKSPGALGWYYLPNLIGGLFPWSLFLPLGLVLAFRRLRAGRDRQLWLLLFWFLGGLALFSVGGKKASRYLLPMLPAGALVVGWYFRQLASATESGKGPGWGALVGAGSVSLLGVLAGVAILAGLQDPAETMSLMTSDRTASDAAMFAIGWQAVADHAWLAGLISLAAIGVSLWAFRAMWRGRVERAVFGYAAFAWLLLAVYFYGVLPLQSEGVGLREVAREIARKTPPDVTLYGGGEGYQRALHWYLRRNFELKSQDELLLLARKEPGAWIFIMHREPLPVFDAKGKRVSTWGSINNHVTLIYPRGVKPDGES